jgi:hypothetical protein
MSRAATMDVDVDGDDDQGLLSSDTLDWSDIEPLHLDDGG